MSAAVDAVELQHFVVEHGLDREPDQLFESVDLDRGRIDTASDHVVDSAFIALKCTSGLTIRDLMRLEKVAEGLSSEWETHLGSPPIGVIDQRSIPALGPVFQGVSYRCANLAAFLRFD
ncbi:MAG TPA: hypothetical protein VNQ48_02570 [Microbacteriaceae bacterium]|nr:hypothetical protein [Microbacteriaceae bacterium]